MSAPVVIAVDLGGTWLRTALVAAARDIVQQWRRPVEIRRGAVAIGALLTDALREAHTWARGRSIEPSGVGLAVPGLVDAARGIIRYSANLELHDVAVAEIAQAVVSGPVAIENDVRAAAWGEWRWGAGYGTRYMVYLSAGTGIAAALIWNGGLYRGSAGAAGELGHVPLMADGDPCSCGYAGCLETVAGGWGIAQRAGRRGLVSSTVAPEGREAERLTAEGVFAAAADGNRIASDVVAEAGEFLGRAAVSLVRLWNPERLVLGGGLLFEDSPLVTAVRTAVKGSPLAGETPPGVALSKLGADSGLLGAACLVLPGESPAPPA